MSDRGAAMISIALIVIAAAIVYEARTAGRYQHLAGKEVGDTITGAVWAPYAYTSRQLVFDKPAGFRQPTP